MRGFLVSAALVRQVRWEVGGWGGGVGEWMAAWVGGCVVVCVSMSLFEFMMCVSMICTWFLCVPAVPEDGWVGVLCVDYGCSLVIFWVHNLCVIFVSTARLPHSLGGYMSVCQKVFVRVHYLVCA